MKRKRQNKLPLILALVVLLAVTAAAVLGVTALTGRQKPAWDGGYSVHISEVMSDNQGCPNAEGVLCDWIEVENTAGSDFDLSGYYLSDEAGKGKYCFPSGSVIPAGGHLVVWCSLEAGEDYAPFALKKEGGENVCLMNANRVVLDQAVTVPCRAGQSLVRENGVFVPCDTPSPGYPNDEAGAAAWQAVVAERSGGRLELSEIMAANSLYAAPDGGHYDWIEVRNPTDAPVVVSGYRISDREDKFKYTFPDGTLGPGEYMVIWCSAERPMEDMAPFALAKAGGETVVLTMPNGAVADSVTLPALEKNTVYCRNADVWAVSDRPTPGWPNDEAGYAAYLAAGGYQEAEIYISEIMDRNRGAGTDADGDFSDWIELVNTGSDPVSLEGWFLSDSEELLTDWAFPAVTVEPGEYLLLYASGKNRTGEELHTGFALSEGETLFLSTPNGIPLRSLSIPQIPEGCSLAMREDGEYRPALYPTPGQPNTAEGYARFADGDKRESLLLLWEAAVYDAQRGDWAELKNVSGSDIDLSDYILTDNPNKSEKYQSLSGILGPGEIVLVPCTAFGLNQQSDEIYLLRGDRVVDCAFLRQIPTGGSYGRIDGRNGFFYFTQATPGAENGTEGWRMVAEKPAADTAPGVYDEAESLTVALAGENIHYTTDGSVPTASSPAYTGPMTITETTVIRAASFPDGQLPGDTATLCYFLRENSSLPIVSLVANNDDLFGYRGIYANHETAWQQGWEQPANLSFFEEDGSFSIDCGVGIHGRTSRRVSEKRSMKLKFRGRYGGELHYDVFGDGEILDFSSLLLRAAVEETSPSYLRDVLFADMAMDFTDVPAQNYRYVSLFINGKYWGVYAIREHHSDDYFAAHYGVDADSVDVRNGEYRNPGVWADLLTYAENHYLGSAESWQYIQEHLDVPEMIDWLILECWGGDYDVYENVRFYTSPQYENGKVLYGLADMDLTMLPGHHETYSVGFENWPQLHAIIPRALLQNAEFKDMFLTRLGSLLQNEMSDDNVLARIDALAAVVEPETARDLARWGASSNAFAIQVANLRNFTTGRAKEMANAAQGYFGLSQAQMEKYFGSLAY